MHQVHQGQFFLQSNFSQFTTANYLLHNGGIFNKDLYIHKLGLFTIDELNEIRKNSLEVEKQGG